MKRAMSSVITTVLIVFLSIALIGILAAFVFPLVKNSISFSGLSSSLDIKEAVYDSMGKSLYLSLARGNDEINLTGLVFKVYVAGNTVSYVIRDNLPGFNEEKSFQLTEIDVQPDSVAVSPIAKKGNTEKILSIADKSDVVEGKWAVGAQQVDSEVPLSPAPVPEI